MDLLTKLGGFWNFRAERCGVILRTGEIVELPNLCPDPTQGFEMDHASVQELDCVATWHTHPTTGGNLSIPDYHLYLQHPELWHYIVGAPDDIRCYYVEDGVVLQHDQDPTQGVSGDPLP